MSLTPQDHVIDDFAGAGGWHHALRALGADPHNYELNPDACGTLRATGSTRVHQGDLTTRTTGHQPPARLYVASPPCQGFSMAGLGAGRQPHVMGAITHAATMIRDGRGYAAAAAHVHTVCPDPRVALVLWPLYWALTTRPENIALEQVPAVLPIWQLCARLLTDAGYSTATGYLTAEQYDVPQTRKRAVLIASRTHAVALPTPTRRKYRKGVPQGGGDPALLPWISMAQALARTDGALTSGTRPRSAVRPISDPAMTLAFGRDAASFAFVPEGTRPEDLPQLKMRSNYGTGGDPANRGERTTDEPAATVTSKIDRNQWQLVSPQSVAGGPRATRRSDEPALTVTGSWDGRARITGMAQAGAASTMVDPRPLDAPAGTIVGKATAAWVHDRPATTEQGDSRVWPPGHKVNQADRDRLGEAEASARYGDRAGTHALRVTVEEAGVLQGFPADYPFQGRTKGSQYLQVGNAIPPPLAWHVLRAALRLDPAPWEPRQ